MAPIPHNNKAFKTPSSPTDFEAPIELLVGNYGRRWRVENGIAEAVKFFHINTLSSPILIKVHFDVVMTMIADTLYGMLAQKLRGFEQCNSPKLYRHFIRGKANVKVKGDEAVVTYPRRAHNPILRAFPWNHLPRSLSWLEKMKLVKQSNFGTIVPHFPIETK